ncbi:MAG: hypothetical protein HYX55_05815 [Chloroflexi bacterium]|nr:hypothetical protein [Chloroflexota bacterium]
MNLRQMIAIIPAVLVLAACGGSSGPASRAPTTSTGGPPTTAAQSPTSGGGVAGAPKGYDCGTLLTAAELDQAASLKGGTVTTVKRGDQPSVGEIPGVTECGINFPTVGDWAGSFHVFTGSEALTNFSTEWDIGKQSGAVVLAGVGGDALIVSTPELGVRGYARGNGVALDIGVSWDDQSTTEQKVKDAVKQILTTVLPRATS